MQLFISVYTYEKSNELKNKLRYYIQKKLITNTQVYNLPNTASLTNKLIAADGITFR